MSADHSSQGIMRIMGVLGGRVEWGGINFLFKLFE